MDYPRTYTVAASPAPLSTHNAYTTWAGGVDPSAALFNTDNQKGGKNRKAKRKNSRKNSGTRKANRKNSRKNSRKNTRKN